MTAQVLERLYRRIMGALAPARIRAVDDTGSVQKVQIDYGPAGVADLRDATPAVGLFGLASNPPAGSDCVVIHFGGARDKAVVIATNNQADRLKNLGSGDSALYDVRGAYIWLTPTGIKINAAGQAVEVDNCSTFTVNATTGVVMNTPTLKVSGDIIDNSGSNTATLKNLRDAYDAHKHTGVTAGSASTGPNDHNV